MDKLKYIYLLIGLFYIIFQHYLIIFSNLILINNILNQQSFKIYYIIQIKIEVTKLMSNFPILMIQKIINFNFIKSIKFAFQLNFYFIKYQEVKIRYFIY